MVVEFIRQWMPQVVDYSQRPVAIRYSIDKYTQSEQVMYIVKVLAYCRVPVYLLIYTVDVFGSAEDLCS